MGLNRGEVLVCALMVFLLIVVILGGNEKLSAYPGRVNSECIDPPADGCLAENFQELTPPVRASDPDFTATWATELSDPTDAKLFTLTVRRGQTLSSILKRRGVKASEGEYLNRSLEGVYDIRDIRPGRSMRIWLSPGRPAQVLKLTYQIDASHLLEVRNHNGVFKARKIACAEQVNALESSAEPPPFDTLLPATGQTIPDVLVPDWSERDAAIIFLSSPPVTAHRTSPRHRRIGKAQAHKKMFLEAPLRYKRISSGYSHSRKHPVHRVRKPHLGIDYAAPMGMAVRSVGQGTVVFVGSSGGFGRCVQIRHPYGYTTYYGHLSRYAKGISVGARVAQGRVIGYVGQSGIATGPHLDFRVSHHGRFINPLKLGSIRKPV